MGPQMEEQRWRLAWAGHFPPCHSGTGRPHTSRKSSAAPSGEKDETELRAESVYGTAPALRELVVLVLD